MEMNIYEAIASIMAKGCAIGKEKRNQQQGFLYRGIDDVMNAFNPLLAEHGVFVVPEVLEATREERQTSKGGNLIYSVLRVKYTFYASDGSNVSAVVVGEGMDSGDKASNKAMAVAMKYAMFQVFCIPTEEMQDPDAQTPPPSSRKDPSTRPGGLAQDDRRAPEPRQEAPREAQKFTCECCGKTLMPYTDSQGRNVSLRAHAERSVQKFGKVLCFDCMPR
jgi:hypothetical protein